MTNADAQSQARIARLEEALAEYALRFGLTERARELLRSEAAEPTTAGERQQLKPV